MAGMIPKDSKGIFKANSLFDSYYPTYNKPLPVISDLGPPNPTKKDPDYDMAGYVAKYGPPDQSKGQHLTDEFKLPNHVTFSTESRYSTPAQPGGTWQSGGQDRWLFTPSAHNLKQYPPEHYKTYFKEQELKGTMVQLPSGKTAEGTKTSEEPR